MNIKILSKDKDPMGAAILDYQKSERVGRLRVLSSMFEEDEMPVKHLFRKVEEMPMLEQKALQLTKGRVLDIGAGSGCHTLALQEKGLEVKAIDISPLSCEAMELRGVMDASQNASLHHEGGGILLPTVAESECTNYKQYIE